MGALGHFESSHGFLLRLRQGFIGHDGLDLGQPSNISSRNTELWPFGELLRASYEETKNHLLQITGHKDLLEGDPYLRQRLRLCYSYITTLNVCQAYTLKRIRDPNYHVKLRPHISKEIIESSTSKPAAELVKLNPSSEYAPSLEDTLILTMKGIAAGM